MTTLQEKPTQSKLHRIILNQDWTFRDDVNEIAGAAKVPGCIHTDLLDNELIDSPFYRDNESKQLWIAEKTWIYATTFDLTKELFSSTKKEIVFHSLDTLATISLNGKVLGKADNQFRIWRYDISTLVQERGNELKIEFHPATDYCREKQKEDYMYSWGTEGDDITVAYKFEGSAHMRKSPCNFGWDWGPQFIICGIKADIEILGINEGQINDVEIVQNHKSKDLVELDFLFDITLLNPNKNYFVKSTIRYQDDLVEETKVPIEKDPGAFKFSSIVEKPHLWWPNNMGDPNLYDVEFVLLNEDNIAIDELKQSIGLRTIQLVQEKDEFGESFYFKVNGIKTFAKGANWIPADVFENRITTEDYQTLLESARDANMNMIRVWGGGIYEPNSFYDICSQLGLLVWQDFMFACSMYPSTNESFMYNVEQEAIDVVKRIRNQACLATWCGNNEIECGFVCDDPEKGLMTWEEYDRLFNVLLPNVVKKYNPQTSYCASSGYSTVNRDNPTDPTSGDAHLWKVWHEHKPFEDYRKDRHRFVSEFGFQSFPCIETLKDVFKEEDFAINNYMMEYHQRSPIGNSTIIHYMLDWLQLPTSFENLVIATQILQSIGIKYAIEHWRRIPETMGALYWQLNDCWQAPSWSSIDYNHRWKALQYEAKRAFNPLLISGVENLKDQSVEIHVTSDLLSSKHAEVECVLYSTEGRVIHSEKKDIVTPVNRSTLVDTVDLSNILKGYNPRDIIIFLNLRSEGEVLSSNFVTFKKPKHITFEKPSFTLAISEISKGEYELLIETDKPCLWVWIESEDKKICWDNQFFHMQPKTIYHSKTYKTTIDDINKIQKTLEVKSLMDLY